MGLLGYPVTIGEFFGGLGLIFGFLCRFSAASLIVIMLGAIGLVHGQHGFFRSRPNDTHFAASNAAWRIGLLAPSDRRSESCDGRFLPLPKSAQTGRPIMVLE
jgi:uncharacterized membrane protein YphA (DoxX/SURF4 family)